jgi:hypothetical protein
MNITFARNARRILVTESEEIIRKNLAQFVE